MSALKRTRGRVVMVDSLVDFDRRIREGASSFKGWHLQALDLTGRADVLNHVEVIGALFLGCRFADDQDESMRERGAVVFPELPDTPVHTWRTALYTPQELYDTLASGGAYEDSLDARAYAWSEQPDDRDVALGQALHDHAIDQALQDWVPHRKLVGVMGGHNLRRGHDDFAFAARLGQRLGRRFVVATGGGPGAMEAANLGAFLASASEHDLERALAILAAVPSYGDDVGAWAESAFEVIDRFGPALDGGGESLGIPTWHYGHEPPNPFATAIAKYFRNATRESILLEVCDQGIIFLPGAAGTVQEIFQDACENYYADESSVAPMILVGRQHWTERVPAWPLLKSLARGRAMEQLVHLVDTLDEVEHLLTD